MPSPGSEIPTGFGQLPGLASFSILLIFCQPTVRYVCVAYSFIIYALYRHMEQIPLK